MNDIKICVLGGDLRQLSAIQTMYKKGYDVKVFGIDENIPEAKKANSLKEAVYGCSLILLPLPFSADGIRIFCPLSCEDIKLDDLASLLTDGQIVAGGKFTTDFCKKLTEKGCKILDYYTSERLSILNAIPTAEGALAIAMNELKITMFGSKCAVVGYGRIGKILSKMLKKLDSDVTVFARSEEALTWAEADGVNAVNIKKMAEYISDKHVIFNTVPSMVIDRSVLDKTKNNVIIIDLASAPGGVDFEYAKKTNKKVIFALSLPGKVAPETAGNIIANTVISKVSEVYL